MDRTNITTHQEKFLMSDINEVLGLTKKKTSCWNTFKQANYEDDKLR